MAAPLPSPPLAGVAGLRFSSVAAGIRADGRPDLALAVSDADATVAALFTKNRVVAAPVTLACERVPSGRARALLVNSGCANAVTGLAGARAAEQSCARVAAELGIAAELVLPASTGVIGQLLPVERLSAAVPALVEGLSADRAGDFAAAICTTDAFTKTAEATLEADGGTCRLLVIGKGAGMIHPELGRVSELPSCPTRPPTATMLVFVFTDAKLDAGTLEQALASSAARTLCACTVDGDTSTNDTLLAVATGASGLSPRPGALERGLDATLGTIARLMVLDGEGAEHAVELRVSGLATDAEARTIAKTVACSLLVKTALHGRDANWGRLLAAAGRAGVTFDPTQASVSIAGTEIVRGGLALGAAPEAEAERGMAAREYAIDLRLGEGPGRASYLTSDLGHGYVNVNASYRS